MILEILGRSVRRRDVIRTCEQVDDQRHVLEEDSDPFNIQIGFQHHIINSFSRDSEAKPRSPRSFPPTLIQDIVKGLAYRARYAHGYVFSTPVPLDDTVLGVHVDVRASARYAYTRTVKVFTVQTGGHTDV